MSLETRISLEEDPDRREQLIRLQKISLAKNMKPEEVLAMNAAESPEAARALEAIFSNKGAESEKREKLQKEHTEQLERILNKTLDSMATAAKRAGDVNINK